MECGKGKVAATSFALEQAGWTSHGPHLPVVCFQAADQDLCWYQHCWPVRAGKEDTSSVPLMSSVSERGAVLGVFFSLREDRGLPSAEHLQQQGCHGLSLPT